MTAPPPKVGDSVAVDLTGVYFGVCEGCWAMFWLTPGAGCMECDTNAPVTLLRDIRRAWL